MKKPKTVKSAAKGAVRKSELTAKQAAAVSPAKSPAKAAGKGVKRPRKSDGALSDSTNAAEDVIVGSGRQVGLSAKRNKMCGYHRMLPHWPRRGASCTDRTSCKHARQYVKDM